MRRVAGNGVYRGVDRRSRRPLPDPDLRLGYLLRHAGILALGCLIPLAFILLSGFRAEAASTVLQLLWGLGAVVAGVAMLVCWRIGGRAAPGWAGVAFLSMGILSVAYQSLSLLNMGTVGAVEPYGRVVICVLVASSLVAGLRSPEVDSSFRPLQAAAIAAVIGVGGLDILQKTMSGRYPGVTWQAGAQGGTSGACCVVWASVFLLSCVLYRKKPTSTGLWMTAVTAIYALSSGTTTALSSRPWGLVAGQTGFLLSSSLALTAASWELRGTVKSQDRYVLDLSTGLDAMREEMERERADVDERLHDLRNAVTAVRSADITLRRYAAKLDETTRESLAEAISTELGRLQTLIEPERKLRRDRFCLPDALEPVLATESTRGAHIETDIPALYVQGDRDVVAQVVQNLLTNARQYAPGANVLVRAVSAGDHVSLTVHDDGPGIARDERLSIFGRGVRGTSSAGTIGSGIGLHIASTLIADMGGNLRLADSDRGACFIVELPAVRVPSRPASMVRASACPTLAKASPVDALSAN